MNKLLAYLTFITFSFLSPICFAWNSLGHQVVAVIAYHYLTPQAQAQIKPMLLEFMKEYPEKNSFVSLAAWPDEIRGQKIELFTHWHYIDNVFSTDGTPLVNVRDTDNAVWAMQNFLPVVANQHANLSERARFLSFMIHVTGDLHQPLHGVSRISAAYPGGDKGGNLFLVHAAADSHSKNLHSVWDEGLGFLNPHGNADNIATMVMHDFPRETFAAEVNNLDPNHWADEDMTYAKNFVYTANENKPLSQAYIHEGTIIVEKRLALAGYRLANLLNKILVT